MQKDSGIIIPQGELPMVSLLEAVLWACLFFSQEEILNFTC